MESPAAIWGRFEPCRLRFAEPGSGSIAVATCWIPAVGNDAGLDQRRVERDRVMADGEQEAVAPLPPRLLRAVAQGMEVGDRQDVRDAERLGRLVKDAGVTVD